MTLRTAGVAAALALGAAFLMTTGGVRAEQQPAAPAPGTVAPNDKDLFSYGVGFTMGEKVGNGLKDDGVGADLDMIVKGFVDGLHSKDPAMPREKIDEVMRLVDEEMQKRMVTRLLAEDPAFKKLHDENLRKSREYVEAHRNDKGIIAAPTGVLYTVLKAGSGPSPKATDTVIVNYTGTLIDGTQYDAADAIELRLDQIRRTASQTLQMMHVGDKWHVIMPPELAYGPAGKPPMVGPNEALIIDVELVKIK